MRDTTLWKAYWCSGANMKIYSNNLDKLSLMYK